MKTFGSAIVTLFLLIVGIGMALGVLLGNPNLFNPDQARQEAYVASQRAHVELTRANNQLVYERQQQEIALVNQRARGEAFAQVIQYGGIALAYALAVSIVMIAIAYTYQIIVDAMIGLRGYKATHPTSPARAMPKPVALEPLRFPDPQQAQRMRKAS